MIVGALQYKPKFHDVEYNLNKVEEMLDSFEGDICVLPELFNTGYMFEDREDLSKYAEDYEDSKTVTKLIDIAKRKSCAIVAGLAERKGDKIYNSSVFVTDKGIETIYRKLHLFWDEKDIFDTGDKSLPIIKYKDTMFGLMVCFDWAFPEVVRTLAMKGAEIICQPADLVLTYCQQVMIARSIENKVFTITSNRLGKERIKDKELEFTGNSQITNVKGKLLAQTKDEEKIISADINPDEARDKSLTPKNDVFKDRRPDFYY